ncbi:MAG: spore cortex biosynthesis protein YabQ [Clostridia bacterium]|nr:spore cortex biosynthesis protein YabQ [Clostridia bacterium]
MNDFFYDSWLVILKFLIPGIFLGAVYDIFRLIRIARNDRTYNVRRAVERHFFPKTVCNEKTKKYISEYALVLIEDILFFLIVAVTEILAIFHLNGGEIRMDCLMISVVGFFVYQKTLGRLIIFFSVKILYLIRRTIYLVVCVVLTPIFFFSKQTVKCFKLLRSKRKEKTAKDDCTL